MAAPCFRLSRKRSSRRSSVAAIRAGSCSTDSAYFSSSFAMSPSSYRPVVSARRAPRCGGRVELGQAREPPLERRQDRCQRASAPSIASWPPLRASPAPPHGQAVAPPRPALPLPRRGGPPPRAPRPGTQVVAARDPIGLRARELLGLPLQAAEPVGEVRHPSGQVRRSGEGVEECALGGRADEKLILVRP